MIQQDYPDWSRDTAPWVPPGMFWRADVATPPEDDDNRPSLVERIKCLFKFKEKPNGR